MSLVIRIRRIIPTAKSLKQVPGCGWLESFLERRPWLLSITRRRVARGIGVGLAVGVIPLPTQMVMAAFCAVALRANVGAAVAATWFTNPLTAGPIWALSGWLGSFFVDTSFDQAWQTTQAIAEDIDHILPWWDFLREWTLAIGKPVLVGLPFTGLLLGVSSWALISLIWAAEVKSRRRARLRLRQPK